MPEPATLFVGILFSSIGLAAFLYGRKQAQWSPLVFGSGLVAASFLIDRAWLLALVGVVLCAAMYWFRE